MNVRDDRLAPTRKKRNRYKTLPLQVTVFLAVFLLAVHVKFFTVGPFQHDDVTNHRDVATLNVAANMAVGDVGSSDVSVRGRLGRALLQETVTTTVDDQQHNPELHSSSNSDASSNVTNNHTGSDEAGGHSSSGQHQVFPESLFTQQQLLDGAIVLYVLGDVYMFICLALVCEEFFVPAVTIITEHFGLSEDVAGATLFAFAGSGPEIFTSFIGVFISQTSIGIGTIVGSAVFNLTVVHGICAVVSSVAIQLGWWAVLRDFFFYSLSLVLLIIFFADDLILWWESLLLICTYIIYVTFMKYNQRIREWLQSRFCAKSVGESSIELPDHTDHHHTAGGEGTDDKLHKIRGGTTYSIGRARRRPSVMRLVMQFEWLTVFGLGSSSYTVTEAPSPTSNNNNNIDDNTNNGGGNTVNGIHGNGAPAAPYQLPIKVTEGQPSSSNGRAVTARRNSSRTISVMEGSVQGTGGEADSTMTSPHHSMASRDTVMSNDTPLSVTRCELSSVESPEPSTQEQTPDAESNGGAVNGDATSSSSEAAAATAAEEMMATPPSLLSWPITWRKRITFIVILPALVPLCLTLPDVRHPAKRKYCLWTFTGSVVWIAVFSYCLSWWATVIGNALSIPSAEMGLIFLAFGTSVPDLIASVIVVKRGFGDMAVSGSFGSNILDITVGLPLPWLLFSIANGPYKVSNEGLLCSMIMMFLILIITVLMTGIGGWRLTRPMGVIMFGMYVIFVVFSALIEHGVLSCPRL